MHHRRKRLEEFYCFTGRSSDLLLRIESVEQANRNVKARLKAMDPRELIDMSLGILYSERNQICASRNLINQIYTTWSIWFNVLTNGMLCFMQIVFLWNILSDIPSKLIQDTQGKAGTSIQKESCEKRKMRASQTSHRFGFQWNIRFPPPTKIMVNWSYFDLYVSLFKNIWPLFNGPATTVGPETERVAHQRRHFPWSVYVRIAPQCGWTSLGGSQRSVLRKRWELLLKQIIYLSILFYLVCSDLMLF